MNLDEKTTAMTPPVDPPTQPTAEPIPVSPKRRKAEGASPLAITRKPKKGEALTDGDRAVKPKAAARRPRKKALVFDDSTGDGVGLADLLTIKADTALARVLAMPTADTAPVVVQPAAAEPVAAPEPVPTVVETAAPPAETAPASPPAGEATPLGEAKSSVFMVATLLMRESADEAEEAASEAAEMPAVTAAEPPPAKSEAAPKAEEPAASPAATEPVELVRAAAPVDELPQPIATPAAAESAERVPEPAPDVQPTIKEPRRLAIPAAVEEMKAENAAAANCAPTVLSRSESIARAARMSALSGAKLQSPEALLQAARAAAEQQRAAELAKQPTDIYDYWTRVRNGRRFPARADFDAEQVAESWPNSMLLTCAGLGGNGSVSFSKVLRLDAGRRTRPGEELNFTSMITEWILAIGGEAARAGQPVQDTEVFPMPDGNHAYKIVALPLGDQQTRVDHVLCHLSRS